MFRRITRLSQTKQESASYEAKDFFVSYLTPRPIWTKRQSLAGFNAPLRSLWVMHGAGPLSGPAQQCDNHTTVWTRPLEL